MADIFVTSVHSPAISAAGIHALVEEYGGCFDSHRVKWRKLLLARDGSHSLSHLDAADAESARLVMRRLGLGVVSLWSATPLQKNLAFDQWPAQVQTVIEQVFREPLTASARDTSCHSDRDLQRYLSLDKKTLHTFSESATGTSGFFITPDNNLFRGKIWRCQQINTCFTPRIATLKTGPPVSSTHHR